MIINTIKDLLNHTDFRRYFANTSWLFAEKVLRILVGLFVVVWVARYLGPEQFGLLSYAQAFVALFSAIATLGLDGIVVRELVKTPERRDELLDTAFWLKVVGAIATLSVLALAVQFTSNDTYTNFLIFIIASATVFQAFNVVDFYFQATVKGKYIALANSISLFISSLVKIGLILYKAPLIAFAISVAFDSLILALGYIYFYFRDSKAKVQNLKFRISTAKGLLHDSWPLIFSGLVIMIYMRIDQVMIKEMLDERAVGIYSAAVRISEAWYFVPVVITSSLFPAVLNAKKVSEELYYDRLSRLYGMMFWLSIGVALPMTFFSDWIINFFYGQQFQEAGKVLMIHIWAGVFVALGVAGSRWILSENLQIYSTLNTTLGAISNIVLNIILIPLYGPLGAAIATLISQFIASYFAMGLWKRTRINFLTLTKCIGSFGLKRG